MTTRARLLADLQSADPMRIGQAAYELTTSETHRGVAAIVQLIRKGSVEQRAHAAYVLGNWRVKSARPILERLLRDSKTEPKVRDYAAEALGYLGDRKSVPVLIASCNDSSPEVAYACCIAFSNIGDIRALPSLRQLSKRRDRAYGKFSVGNAAREAIRSLQSRKTK